MKKVLVLALFISSVAFADGKAVTDDISVEDVYAFNAANTNVDLAKAKMEAAEAGVRAADVELREAKQYLANKYKIGPQDKLEFPKELGKPGKIKRAKPAGK